LEEKQAIRAERRGGEGDGKKREGGLVGRVWVEKTYSDSMSGGLETFKSGEGAGGWWVGGVEKGGVTVSGEVQKSLGAAEGAFCMRESLLAAGNCPHRNTLHSGGWRSPIWFRKGIHK